MTVMFELVIINSSCRNLRLANESLPAGTSDVPSRSLLIPPKGVQRYKFKAAARSVLEGTVTIHVEDGCTPVNAFTVDFYHINNKWAAVEMPTPSCIKEFQQSYILDGTTFQNKKTLSMAIEFSNLTNRG